MLNYMYVKMNVGLVGNDPRDDWSALWVSIWLGPDIGMIALTGRWHQKLYRVRMRMYANLLIEQVFAVF